MRNSIHFLIHPFHNISKNNIYIYIYNCTDIDWYVCIFTLLSFWRFIETFSKKSGGRKETVRAFFYKDTARHRRAVMKQAALRGCFGARISKRRYTESWKKKRQGELVIKRVTIVSNYSKVTDSSHSNWHTQFTALFPLSSSATSLTPRALSIHICIYLDTLDQHKHTNTNTDTHMPVRYHICGKSSFPYIYIYILFYFQY